MERNEDPRAVIEFWRAAEMFSPPPIPKVDPKGRIFEAGPDGPLPWEGDHRLRQELLADRQNWRYTVYLGSFPRGAVFEKLRPVFDEVSGKYDERLGGESALLALTVSDKGTLIEGSVVLSACAWAMERALDPGPGASNWLDGFADLEAQFAQGLEEIYIPIDEDGGPSPVFLDWGALEDCRDRARAALGVDADFQIGDIRVRSERVRVEKAEVPGNDFLNSFIADDLALVASAAGRGRIGAALREYLRPSAEVDLGRRVDVRSGLDEVRRATAPDRVPSGRWPAAPDRAPALGQQLAVCQVRSMGRADEHLFAVNGPPGTGKTTMLRELVASLVTERAERLAALAHPRDAFSGETYRWDTGNYKRTVHRLRPELTGFEMVVASSNNGAVENVTLEIPSSAAIDAPWEERARDPEGLRLLAEQAMNAARGAGSGPSAGEGDSAWALVAAPLGRSSNRRRFVQEVWWSRDPDGEHGRARPPGLRDLLVGWEGSSDPAAWAGAVGAFRSAREREAAIRADRVGVAAALERRGELEARLAAAREIERAARDRVIASRARRDELVDASRRRKEERRRLTEERAEAQRHRPFVLWFWARAAWRDRDRRYATEIAAAETGLREIAADLRPLEAEGEAYDEARAAVGPIGAALEDCRRTLSLYEERPGAVLPDEEWLGDRPRRELRAPWTDAEWNAARTELFLAALVLHRAFLAGAAKQMRRSLEGAFEIISGNAPADLSGGAVPAAWQAFFMVVPVVSTTFASLPRLFKGLGPEALGRLLVDEAGQATPQNVVGGLWRSRRAVIVGDPLQLEPITTIPFKLEEAIRGHYRVGEEWLTGRGSVQTLADRLNRLGTTLPGVEEPVWVGAPLTVHRRCDQPMFDISNAIAYDGSMIDATDPGLGKRFALDYPALPPSRWIDVPSAGSEGHWIPAEGEALDRILIDLLKVNFDFSEVMAIGPFRDVARRLESRRRGDFRSMRAGTIHTAQGREADIVILVLGSDPDSAGARTWAASKPNLLNVAVSRARRRLYVIGDRDRWQRLRHFEALAERLPHDPRRG